MSARERAYQRKLAAMRAKMEAENEALRREAWKANAPARAAAALLGLYLWPESAP